MHRKAFAEAQEQAHSNYLKIKALAGQPGQQELALVAAMQFQNDLACFHLSALSSTLPASPAWWYPNVESVNERLVRHGFKPLQNEAV